MWDRCCKKGFLTACREHGDWCDQHHNERVAATLEQAAEKATDQTIRHDLRTFAADIKAAKPHHQKESLVSKTPMPEEDSDMAEYRLEALRQDFKGDEVLDSAMRSFDQDAPEGMDATVLKSSRSGANPAGLRKRVDSYPMRWFSEKDDGPLSKKQKDINKEHAKWIRDRAAAGKGPILSSLSSDPSIMDDVKSAESEASGGEEGFFDKILSLGDKLQYSFEEYDTPSQKPLIDEYFQEYQTNSAQSTIGRGLNPARNEEPDPMVRHISPCHALDTSEIKKLQGGIHWQNSCFLNNKQLSWWNEIVKKSTALEGIPGLQALEEQQIIHALAWCGLLPGLIESIKEVRPKDAPVKTGGKFLELALADPSLTRLKLDGSCAITAPPSQTYRSSSRTSWDRM